MAPPRPHPLARSPLSQRAGALIDTLWVRGVTPKPPLEPDFLWQVGSKGYGSDDEVSVRSAEDVADFRTRLERLCASLRDEAQLNALGHTMAYGQITAAIRKRHAVGQLWRNQPALPRRSIAPPIIVVGQMRAGTTRVHRLLAADPAHAGTRFCDSHDPLPRVPDLRPLKSAAALAIARRINPWLESLHPFGPTRIDEEIGWLAASLDACTFEAQYAIPAYVRWSESADAGAIYREYARLMRTDAAARGNAHLPRVMKCPQFCEQLPALLAQFPDARLVVARRDHAEVLSSAVSMVAAQTAFQTDHASLARIKQEWQRKLALRAARMDAALAQWTGPVAHVEYAALNADWRSEMARVYQALSLELTCAAAATMEAEVAQSAKDAHHAHAGDLARFQTA